MSEEQQRRRSQLRSAQTAAAIRRYQLEEAVAYANAILTDDPDLTGLAVLERLETLAAGAQAESRRLDDVPMP